MDSQDGHFEERLLALHVPEALQEFIGCARPYIPHKVQGVLCKVLHLAYPALPVNQLAFPHMPFLW